MLDKEYKVRYITSKNSFLFLSDKDYHYSNSQDVLIRLNYGLNKTAYFSLGPPLPSLKEGELALSSLYAKELAIVKNDTVTLSSTTRISSVRRLTIVPSSNDDYEILELLSDTVQSILLGQVRIVHNGQKLIIWISNSIHVTVMVDGIIPISPGKLENMTEVSIMPADTQIATKDNVQKQPETKKSSHKTPTLVNLFCSFISALFRVHPTEILALKEECLFKQPFNVFLNQKDLPAWFQEIESTKDTIVLGKLHVITPPLDLQDSEVNEDRKDVFVRILNLEEFGIGNDSNVIFVNSALREILRISTGSRVILEKFKDVIGLGSTGRIKIKTNRKLFSTAVEIVRNYLLSHCKNEVFVVNSNVQLSDQSGNKFLLSFEPDTPYCLADKLFISSRRNLFIIDDNEIVFNAEDDKKIEKELELCLDSSNFSKIFEDIEKCVDLKFSYLVKDSVNILIVGKPGSGKSSLASYITQKLSMSRHQVHPEFVNCKKLKGKNVDSLLKILNAKFARLIYFQPSILILDDLHVICEKVIEGEAPTQENLHFNKISEILANFLEDCLQKNCIAILATSESIHKLNQNIYSSRGRQIFKNVFSIDDLTKSDRIKLMKYFFNLKNIEYKNVDENILGVETEGFVMQDLIDCIDKIMFESFKENPTQKLIKISSKHCENAIKQSSSLSMREVQLHSPGDRDFDDVGGMGDVKKILIECMLWPLQYPQIFDKSPLRLQSGLLLYGPPGTGKTIIAAAAAKHCNLRLISIKGPELLSKYIGASEQAVRDVFLKAQTAKPCILFFDEFDSLAPRRGHDNTGVTDRVVNQFLTQLDGVESLSGVCVLAATSRPDLLDPALLRPGRLDRQILCPLPDKDSRLEILKALSKKINLTEDINLSKLAVESVGFSGADLQAVLCTAQLNSVEHLLDNDKEEFSSTDKIVITQKHLDDALKSTKPSLTREEKLKYERIYSKFQSKGDQLDLLQGKQKSTLA